MNVINRLGLRSTCTVNNLFKINSNILRGKTNNYLRVYATSTDIDNSGYDTIFMLPQIQFIAPVCTLPKYVCGVTAVTLPISAGLEYLLQVLPSPCTMYVGIAGALFTTMTSLFNLVFKDTIGFIYISHDSKNLKVATVNKWGKRSDDIIPVEDWIPISELPYRRTDKIFLTARRYSCNQTYKLFYRQGKVLDETIASQTIGSL